VDHQSVLTRVLAWARDEENIRAMVLTGSLARADGTSDDESDLDIELYASNPAPLLENDAWYHQFGEVLVVEALPNEDWNPTRLVYYADGKIDFMIGAASLLAEGIAYERPFRVLLDKDGHEEAFRSAPPQEEGPPTEREYLECVHWFYAAVIMWAKYLRRNEPWLAKLRDGEAKDRLLTMLEWDHKARKGWDYDTWYLGAHWRQWADPDLQAAINDCWADISFEDSTRALWARMELFARLNSRTAATLGFASFDDAGVRRRVKGLLKTGQTSR
jgi:aminoglycoside 6-adenylyltransferase